MAGARTNGRPPVGRRTTRSQAQPPAAAGSSRKKAVPREYRHLLREAGAAPSSPSRLAEPEDGEPPAKRPRRPGQRDATRAQLATPKEPTAPTVKPSAKVAEASEPTDDADEDEDEDIEFEDVALPEPTIQTTYQDSEDDDDDDDVGFEDVDFGALPADAPEAATLELDLSTHRAAAAAEAIKRRGAPKRKPTSRTEKERRVEVHKLHICCLLVHAARRNRWCDDAQVQSALRPLLPDKVVDMLKPRSGLTQFGRSESLKDGLVKARGIFQSAFNITERGLRRALWAEEPSHLEDYQAPEDLDSALDKTEFRKSAKYLDGSRDVGAQLFCALLRSVGVETRLVCSLQPLSFVSSTPTLQKPRLKKAEAPKRRMPNYDSYKYVPPSGAIQSSSLVARRLGHPNAAAYVVPPLAQQSLSAAVTKEQGRKPVTGESAFPVYWVEVLDEAHQKWQPVDPIVTCSQARPAKLEPPLTDRLNCLCYAVSFASDGTARDVTRRYAKAYTSKTRRMRVDTLPVPTSSASLAAIAAGLTGEEWYARALSFFARPLGIVTDLDRSEEAELATTAGREPMPRNVADFKGHPTHALERHLKRNEVLIPGAKSSGTVGVGGAGGGRGKGKQQRVERIYRRRDVRIAWSEEKWYRMGRVVRPGEVPVKHIPRRPKPKSKSSYFENRGGDEPDEDDDVDEDPVLGPSSGSTAAGVPIFTEDQTDPYEPPLVVNGHVPKNKFGNVEVFVPSMVPRGGVHLTDELAARAAFVLGVDYAPALTGFEFRDRKGTAVLRGVVVPAECEEAVRLVAATLGDLEAEAEEARRNRALLRLWSRFLKVLRLDEMIGRSMGLGPSGSSSAKPMLEAAAADDGQEEADEVDDEQAGRDDGMEDGGDGGNGIADDVEDDDDTGGGFVAHNDYGDDDDMGGGFMVE
ncbi:hypothetical protein RB598_006608 [Gaeumannomyces tritici]